MSLQISDEMIHAFIDNELDQQDRQMVKQAMQGNLALRQRIEYFYSLKKDIKNSYQQLPSMSGRLSAGRGHVTGLRKNAAMVALLLVGLLFGWFMRGAYIANGQGQEFSQTVQLNDSVQQQDSKVIFHVSTSDPKRLDFTLRQVSAIIEKFSRHRMDFEIEVVAHANGIDLLREDVSPYKNEIMEVMDRYQNVTFFACNNSIDRLRLKGIKPRMIDRTQTGVTAVDQIVKRLRQGWVYLKV